MSKNSSIMFNGHYACAVYAATQRFLPTTNSQTSGLLLPLYHLESLVMPISMSILESAALDALTVFAASATETTQMTLQVK